VLGQERDNAGDTSDTSRTSNHMRNVGVEFYPIAYDFFFLPYYSGHSFILIIVSAIWHWVTFWENDALWC